MSGWTYWRKRRELGPAYTRYLARLALLLSLPVLGVAILWLAELTLGLGLPMVKVAVGVAVGVVFGEIISVAYGVVLGVGFGVAVGVGFGVAGVLGVTGSVAFGLVGSVVFGVLSGVSFGVLIGVGRGVAEGMADGVVGGVLLGTVVGVAEGLVVGMAEGLVVGMAGGVATILSSLRLPIYPLEALVGWGLFLARGQHPARTLRFVPVLFHDLSFLPHPFLARHIIEAADTEPDLSARVLAACQIAPGQRRAGARALAELQARELVALVRQRRFQAGVDLQGRWLPGRESGSTLLRALSETARFLAAAQGSSSPYLARQHLDTAERQLAAIGNLLLGSKEPLARYLPDALAVWRVVLAEMRAENQRAAADQLPNPFITGNPLSGEQPSGREVFRGREATIRQVETLLAGDQASLALIGPRRCGKSSLINMFKVWLPDTQVVLFDLQDNPASTSEGFYRALAEQARRQARQDRGLDLPAFPEGSPIEALRAWLDALEQFPGVARFLICIDEFERLPSLFPGKGGELASSDGLFTIPDMRPSQGRELLQFMGLLRATIQNRRRVRLLVAGAAPFDELDHLWSDHFINLREIRVGYLDEATCVGLLTRPITEFPSDAIPDAVARAVVARTGGQPFLVQLYGSLLVDRLNEAKRKSATLDDIEPVEREVLDQANYYFSHVWGDLPPDAKPALGTALYRGQPVQVDATIQRWLRRRLIVSEDGVLMVPVFGRWVRENVSSG